MGIVKEWVSYSGRFKTFLGSAVDKTYKVFG